MTLQPECRRADAGGGEIDPDWQPISKCDTTDGAPNTDLADATTSGNDTIQGTEGNDVICGGGGSDTINGLGDNDIILGQGGNDQLTGGPGNDILDGGPGTGNMALYTGSTRVIANLTTEFAKGGASSGMDTLLNLEDLSGSSANDTLTGSAWGPGLLVR